PVLPAGDERPGGAVVGDRGPGGGEREPAAGALAAAGDRPGGRRATTGAQRAVEATKPGAAVHADELLPQPARSAAPRKDEIEQAQRAEVERKPEKAIHTH